MRTPLCRDWIAFHTASRPTPIGETIPTPVMTTSRSATLLPGQPDDADDSTKITTDTREHEGETETREGERKETRSLDRLTPRLRISVSCSLRCFGASVVDSSQI